MRAATYPVEGWQWLRPKCMQQAVWVQWRQLTFELCVGPTLVSHPCCYQPSALWLPQGLCLRCPSCCCMLMLFLLAVQVLL